MIYTFGKLNHLKSLLKTGNYITAIESGMEFLRYVGNEYERLKIYNDQYYDGDDFGTQEVEQLLAKTLRKEDMPISAVQAVREEVSTIRKMAAYSNYGLASFDHIDEAISYRLADADTYLADLNKKIELYGKRYWEIMDDTENKAIDMFLFRLDELEEVLQKKIEYLRKQGRFGEAEEVIKDFQHVPAIRSLIIKEHLEAGDDDGALDAIDEGIGIYGDDGYINTVCWHKLKIGILARRGDTKGVIEEYRRLFRQLLSDKETYYKKLKEMVPEEEWKVFATRLFSDIPHTSDEDCILVCDMIVKEHLYGCLTGILMKSITSFHRSKIFSKYAKYINKEGQAQFIGMVMEKLRERLPYMKPKSYEYIADEINILYSSCPTGKKMMSEFVEEIATQYGNRPALMRRLGFFG